MSDGELKLELLLDLGAMIAREVELDQLLRVFGERVARALRADRATLWLVDAGTDAGSDAGTDAGTDAGSDSGEEDAGIDPGSDDDQVIIKGSCSCGGKNATRGSLVLLIGIALAGLSRRYRYSGRY